MLKIRNLFKSLIRTSQFRCSDQKANFGYQKVNLNEKQQHVDKVFHSVAQKYDIMNDVMSLGIHRCWKDSFVEELGLLLPSKVIDKDQIIEQPLRVLDVAGGTGDITFRILQRFYAQQHQFLKKPSLKVTVVDINQSMLDVGSQRSKDLGFTNECTKNNNLYVQEVEFNCANAEELPYEDNTFDIYTIAFGIRNVPRIEKALSEAYRVLKHGGKFQCLEFSKVTNPILAELNKGYQLTFLPIMGQFIANDAAAYQYLAESIDKFHSQEEFLDMIQKSGFQHANYKNYSQGIVAVHYGFKL